MKLFRTSLVIFFLLAYTSISAQSGFQLWYKKPAEKWTDALPVGNGRLAAMVFGKTGTERIQLNEETIWAGSKINDVNPGAREHLKEIQQLLLDEKNEEAYNLTKKYMVGTPPQIRSYQTLGDLYIDWGKGTVTSYKRSLDIQKAVSETRFKTNGIGYTQTVFVSAPHDMLVVRLTSAVKGKLNIRIRLKRTMDAVTTTKENALLMKGQIVDKDDANLKGPLGPHLRFAALALVSAKDGQVIRRDTAIDVRNATEVLIRLTAASDYDAEQMDFDRSIDPVKTCENILKKSTSLSYATILQQHQSEYTPLFNRVSLNLGGSSNLATDERLKKVQDGNTDNDLIALYFQYGRYLLLCSSRFPAKLPANLQGKWNEHYNAPWESDYHTNINLQMNYWPADVTNISETVKPLGAFMLALLEPGMQCAKNMYGVDGWVIHHVTDIYGRTGINGDPKWGTSPLAGAWAALNLFDHYAFTLDENFMSTTGSQILLNAATFILNFLIEDGRGHLVTAPSMSPENGFFLNGDTTKRHVITYAPAIDMQIINELFNDIKSISGVLPVTKQFLSKLDSVQKVLPRPAINRYGGIQEWIKDYDEEEPGHRHMSQLFGLYPGSTITADSGLMRAARITIEHRLKYGGGHTGWSRAWMINFYARLKDGDQAYFHMTQLLKKSTLPNLFDNHPPFQIDGNFGGTAGVAEMLIQSHNGAIEILPALPGEWKTGSVKGLKARGAFEVAIDWKDGKMTKLRVKSLAGKKCTLNYGGKLISFDTRTSKEYIFDGSLNAVK